MTNDSPMLNCTACSSEKSMEATQIKKFNPLIRLIGYIIVTPSVIAIVVFTIGLFNIAMDGAEGGSEAAQGMAIGMVVFMIAAALVSGLIGWLLLMKKKVFKCIHCGFILDRA